MQPLTHPLTKAATPPNAAAAAVRQLASPHQCRQANAEA